MPPDCPAMPLSIAHGQIFFAQNEHEIQPEQVLLYQVDTVVVHESVRNRPHLEEMLNNLKLSANEQPSAPNIVNDLVVLTLDRVHLVKGVKTSCSKRNPNVSKCATC